MGAPAEGQGDAGVAALSGLRAGVALGRHAQSRRADAALSVAPTARPIACGPGGPQRRVLLRMGYNGSLPA
jgi:hypothetical protein